MYREDRYFSVGHEFKCTFFKIQFYLITTDISETRKRKMNQKHIIGKVKTIYYILTLHKSLFVDTYTLLSVVGHLIY